MIEREKSVGTYWVKIFIAGGLNDIEKTCREFCLEGLCVTVTKTNYVFTMGTEKGAIVELVNYPRFPSTKAELEEKAQKLAFLLLEKTYQGSVLLQTPEDTTWYTRRKDYL
jgi:DNA polymerase elongation subunit (family B)